MLAGVNGAGKSSVGGSILQDHGLTWFNPDTYARELVRELGIDSTDANARAWQYGKSKLESAIANGTSFGLSSAAWTTDPAEQELFSNELEAGGVFLNGMTISYPELGLPVVTV